MTTLQQRSTTQAPLPEPQTPQDAERIIHAALGADRVFVQVDRIETYMGARFAMNAEPIEAVSYSIVISSIQGTTIARTESRRPTLAAAMQGLIERALEWFERRAREEEQERFDAENEADRFDMLA